MGSTIVGIVIKSRPEASFFSLDKKLAKKTKGSRRLLITIPPWRFLAHVLLQRGIVEINSQMLAICEFVQASSE